MDRDINTYLECNCANNNEKVLKWVKLPLSRVVCECVCGVKESVRGKE